ncbi:MAG: 4Fe-4S cluster-binding domain-containing protein [Bacteroidales bacterium]|nr:4Fe-4S cluster-binding domain-containing protein [Bacteroidales bacterium]
MTFGNFLGFRVSIWLSGCRRRCKNCFNPQTWDFNSGRPFDDAALKKIENELKKDWCRGTSILGR